MGVEGCTGVGSPGEDEKKHEYMDNDVQVDKGEERGYRGVAARTNYLAADRPDIQYAAKEVCREMARPRRGAWKRLKNTFVCTSLGFRGPGVY